LNTHCWGFCFGHSDNDDDDERDYTIVVTPAGEISNAYLALSWARAVPIDRRCKSWKMVYGKGGKAATGCSHVTDLFT